MYYQFIQSFTYMLYTISFVRFVDYSMGSQNYDFEHITSTLVYPKNQPFQKIISTSVARAVFVNRLSLFLLKTIIFKSYS